MNIIKISVGSLSPHKVKAVDKTIDWLIEKFGDKFHVNYDNVETQVSKQPIGHNEIMEGATNRAWNIYKKYTDSDYTLGIESGFLEIDSRGKSYYKVYDVAAICLVVFNENKWFELKAWSSGIEIPIEYYEKFLQDRRSDPDITLGQSMLKSGIDFCSTDLTSYLTNNLISRSDLLVDPIKLIFAQAFKSEKNNG